MAGMAVDPVYNQSAFRWRNDDGSETTATWVAAENVNPDVLFLDAVYRLRIEVEETASQNQSASLIARLQYNLNGTGWNNVTFNSNVVRVRTSSIVSQGPTTNQLTTSGRAFVAGEVTFSGQASSVILSNQHTEHEFVIALQSPDIAPDDVVQLRIARFGLPDSIALNTYAQTPSFTAPPLPDPDADGTFPVTDSFTDTNGTLIQNHTPDGDNGFWREMGFTVLANAEIQDNRAVGTVAQTGTSRMYRHSAVPGNAEYDVSIDFATGPENSHSVYLMGRASPAGNATGYVDRYLAEIFNMDGYYYAQLQAVIGGSFFLSEFVEDVETGLLEGTYRIRLSLTDDEKSLYIDDDKIVSTADNSITQIGRAGFAAPAPRTGVWVDNFLAEHPGAEPPPEVATIAPPVSLHMG